MRPLCFFLTVSLLGPEDMEDFNKAQADAQKMMSDVPSLGKFLQPPTQPQNKRRK